MSNTKSPSIALRSISITNYKGIDFLTVEFPAPEFDFEHDVTAIVSRNGHGKTSLLECSAILLHCFTIQEDRFLFNSNRYTSVNLPELLVRSGAEKAEVKGTINFDNEDINISIQILRTGEIVITRDKKYLKRLKQLKLINKMESRLSQPYYNFEIMLGFSNEIISENSFIFFHSYRKVLEGNPEFGSLIDSDDSLSQRRFRSTRRSESTSELKIIILQAIMHRAEVLEMDSDMDSNEVITILNSLIGVYAQGEINSKVKAEANNEMDFRINPKNNNDAFSFNGLSSGQKEIISTLFLTWYYTQNRPMTILIDEPELHLNAEWHRKFVNYLVELSPQNQYIITTHSADVYDSAPPNRRLELRK